MKLKHLVAIILSLSLFLAGCDGIINFKGEIKIKAQITSFHFVSKTRKLIIKGKRFKKTTKVKIGITTCQFKIDDDEQLTVDVPPEVTGGEIVVVTPDETIKGGEPFDEDKDNNENKVTITFSATLDDGKPAVNQEFTASNGQVKETFKTDENGEAQLSLAFGSWNFTGLGYKQDSRCYTNFYNWSQKTSQTIDKQTKIIKLQARLSSHGDKLECFSSGNSPKPNNPPDLDKPQLCSTPGTVKWTFAEEGTQFSTPALGSDGTLYVPGNNKLYAVTSEGKKKWAFEASDKITTSAIVDANGVIYFGRYCRFSLNQKSKILRRVDNILEKIIVNKGYEEKKVSVNCINLIVSKEYAKKICREAGLKIVDETTSYKPDGSGNKIFGLQNGLVVVKEIQ